MQIQREGFCKERQRTMKWIHRGWGEGGREGQKKKSDPDREIKRGGADRGSKSRDRGEKRCVSIKRQRGVS